MFEKNENPQTGDAQLRNLRRRNVMWRVYMRRRGFGSENAGQRPSNVKSRSAWISASCSIHQEHFSEHKEPSHPLRMPGETPAWVVSGLCEVIGLGMS